MKHITNALYAIALCASISAVAKNIDSKEVQILLAPGQDWSQYAANIGGEITTDPTIALPAGASLFQSGLILPKGTINLNQQSFLVDHNGNTIDPDMAIGTFSNNSNALVPFDPQDLPDQGTVLNQSSSLFAFNSNSMNTPNQLLANGTQTFVNSDRSNLNMSINGAFGKNESLNGTNARAELHVAPDGQSSVLVVKFEKKIKAQTP